MWFAGGLLPLPHESRGRRQERMKIFHSGSCDQLVFFENTTCVNCGHALAYLPDLTNMDALEPVVFSKKTSWSQLPQ